MSTLLLVLIASWACVLVPTVQDSCPAPSNVSRMNSYLWSVSRHPPAYLFGTIHVPYTRVWDYVALNAKRAFSSSERVYLELDLSDPHTVSELGRCQLLPRGQSLPSLLPRELYLRLKRHLAYVRRRLLGWGSREGGSRRRDPLLVSLSGGEWRRKRPIWLLLLLPWLSEAALRASAREGGGGGSHSPPLLDVHLAREAARARKHVGAVELVHEQCAPLNRLSTAQVVFALNQSLLQHESVRGLWEARGGVGGPWEEPPTPSTEQLIQHYNCGDLTAFVFGQNASQQAGEEEVVEEDEQQQQEQQEEEDVSAQTERYFRTELIQKRNERMGRRVAALLHAHPSSTLFFAFGAGHFLGKNSIIDVLRREGFHVTHTPASQPVGSNEDLDPDFFRGIPKSSSEWNGQEHSSAIRDPFLLSWAPPGPPPAPLGPSFQPARAPGGGKISSGAGGHRQETASRRPQRQHHQHRHHRQQHHQRQQQQQHRREKKRRRQQQQLLRKKQQRKFSDLWVRLYDSTASPPPGMLAALPSDEPPLLPVSPLTPRGHCTARHRGGAHGAAPPTPAVVVAASRSLPDQRVRTLGLLASTSLPLAWTLLLY
ncbi:metalloprotease TIKI1-like isoform X3 [Lethenteron reissneri]|uniref:metalloprotease TIKI1-like isoform X3 n=1 Tax=Lethenteron reissneri TaxID=7753 RepID=UPI002AB69AC6|nr:metalloprotease TIKI1-like isoform X3 [Lethenteron reissneri]